MQNFDSSRQNFDSTMIRSVNGQNYFDSIILDLSNIRHVLIVAEDILLISCEIMTIPCKILLIYLHDFDNTKSGLNIARENSHYISQDFVRGSVRSFIISGKILIIFIIAPRFHITTLNIGNSRHDFDVTSLYFYYKRLELEPIAGIKIGASRIGNGIGGTSLEASKLEVETGLEASKLEVEPL